MSALLTQTGVIVSAVGVARTCGTPWSNCAGTLPTTQAPCRRAWRGLGRPDAGSAVTLAASGSAASSGPELSLAQVACASHEIGPDDGSGKRSLLTIPVHRVMQRWLIPSPSEACA